MGGIRSQAGVQTSCAAGAQITADVGRTDQQNLRLVLVDHVADDLGVCVGGIVLQQRAVADHDLIGTIAAQLFCNAVHVVAQQQTGDLAAQLVGQLPALGDQFKGGGHHHALTLLAEHPYVLERADISTIKSHFLISFLR